MTGVDPKLELLLEVKWAPIERGFRPGPGWEGPFLVSPEQVADLQRRNGLPEEPCWQIIFAQQAPNSRNPDDHTPGGGGVQAAIAFASIDELLNTPTDVLLRKMACSIAGRAAHEALEWVRMDGALVVDPHGSAAAMDEAAAYVRAYLGSAATGP
jgi:hypothetical protein